MRFAFNLNLPDERGDGLDRVRHGEESDQRQTRVRQTRMNTTATFIGLLFFAWLWGLWGILLGIPLLGMVMVVCDANEDWKPVAELLRR